MFTLGGLGNTKTVIRKEIFGTTLAEDQTPRTACDLFKFFWIDWTDGNITLGEGDLVGIGAFLNYSDPTPTHVNHFMISTGWGDTGEWNLGESVMSHHGVGEDAEQPAYPRSLIRVFAGRSVSSRGPKVS